MWCLRGFCYLDSARGWPLPGFPMQGVCAAGVSNFACALARGLPALSGAALRGGPEASRWPEKPRGCAGRPRRPQGGPGKGPGGFLRGRHE